MDVYPKYMLPSGGWTTDQEHADQLWQRALVARRTEVERFAAELGIDPDMLEKGTATAWAYMNPAAYSWGQALSLAGAVLKAAGAVTPPF